MSTERTAQDVRNLLASNGFMPLTRLGDVEHWVRGGRRVALQWPEDLTPGSAARYALYHAFEVQVGDDWLLSLA